jgi:hypothetical protein
VQEDAAAQVPAGGQQPLPVAGEPDRVALQPLEQAIRQHDVLPDHHGELVEAHAGRAVAVREQGDPLDRTDGRAGAEQPAGGRQKIAQPQPTDALVLGGDAEGLERAARTAKPVVQGELEVGLVGDLVGVGDGRQGGGVGAEVRPDPGGEGRLGGWRLPDRLFEEALEGGAELARRRG